MRFPARSASAIFGVAFAAALSRAFFAASSVLRAGAVVSCGVMLMSPSWAVGNERRSALAGELERGRGNVADRCGVHAFILTSYARHALGTAVRSKLARATLR